MISDHIKRNINYTIVCSQSDAESIYAAIKHLQIDPKCSKLIASLLPRHVIVKQAQASWSSAFLAKIDFIEPARNLGAIEYDQHDFVPALDAEQTERIIKQLYKLVSQNKSNTGNNKKTDIEKLSLKLIELWAENPYTPVARLFEKLGDIHYTVQIKIREFIEGKKWANFTEVRIGRSNMLLMELESAGYDALNLPVPQNNIGRGKSEHRHYVHIIKRFAKSKGYKAYLEWKVPGTSHPVDVAVDKNGQMEAYEICVTATDNLVSHAEACFEKSNAIKKLIIIVATKTKLNELKKQIKSDVMLARFVSKIELDIIENYMKRGEK